MIRPDEEWPQFTLTNNAREDAACGYATKVARAEMHALNESDVRRLAAMALTFYESEWSDSQRDLLRGIGSVVRRPCALERKHS